MFGRSPRHPAPTDRGLSLLGRVALLARVWGMAARAQYALWRHPLAEVVAELGALGAPPSEGRRPTALLSRAVSRGLRVGSWYPRCLLRSMVLYHLLRAQGDAAELVIGLPDRPTSSDAHAWVELAGRDVGPTPGGAGYQELTRYPRERKPTSSPAP